MVKPIDLMMSAIEKAVVTLADPKRRGHTMTGATQGIWGIYGQSGGRRREKSMSKSLYDAFLRKEAE